MGIVATCPKCTLPFVVDDLDNDVARGLSTHYGTCESCRRESLNKSIGTSYRSFIACCSAVLFFLIFAARAYVRPRRDTPDAYAQFLCLASLCFILAVFYWWLSSRRQNQLVVALEAEERAGETVEGKRVRLLEELGHCFDHKKEQEVTRARFDRLVDFAMDMDELPKVSAEELKLNNRLRGELAEVERQLHEAQNAQSSGVTNQSDISKLQSKRARIYEEMITGPQWIRFEAAVAKTLIPMLRAVLGLLIGLLFLVNRKNWMGLGVGALFLTVSLGVLASQVRVWWKAWPRISARTRRSAVTPKSLKSNSAARVERGEDINARLIDSTERLIELLKASIQRTQTSLAEIAADPSLDFMTHTGETWQEHLSQSLGRYKKALKTQEELLERCRHCSGF